MTETVTEYAWRFPAEGESAFVLHAKGSEIGWLQYSKQPGLRSQAGWLGRRWTFDHAGPFPGPVFIRSEGSEEVEAVFRPWAKGGGTLEFSAGARYCWNRKHAFSRTWCFRGLENHAEICVSQQAGVLMEGGGVSFCPSAAQSSDMPLLALLAWYLRVLEFENLQESMFVCG